MNDPGFCVSDKLPSADCFKLNFEDVTRELFVELMCHFTKDTNLRARLTNIPDFHRFMHYKPILDYVICYGNVLIWLLRK